MNEWKPIEAAPEGEAVLVIADDWMVVAGRHDGVWCLNANKFMPHSSLHPSHWMPLPEPPA